jgi:hypothetical protein
MSSAAATSVFYQTDDDVNLRQVIRLQTEAEEDEKCERCDFSTPGSID